MIEQTLYDYLQTMLPDGVQFINPFIDKAPAPFSDFVQMTVLPIRPVGLSQNREISHNETNQTVEVGYDLERVYTVQIDFYGKNAYNNALVFSQTLEVNLGENTSLPLHFKKVSEIRNLTDLQENKLFLKRYSFDVELYIVDSISKQKPYLTSFDLKLV